MEWNGRDGWMDGSIEVQRCIRKGVKKYVKSGVDRLC